MLRTSAERALKAVTGQSILAYAQHDTVSQASLILESVKDELALASKKDHAMTISDLEKQTVRSKGFTNFKIQSLFNIEAFLIKIALVVPGFINNEKVFLRAVNKVKLCKLDPLLNWCTAEDYLLDVYFAFFLKSISETNVIDKRWQISAESCN